MNTLRNTLVAWMLLFATFAGYAQEPGLVNGNGGGVNPTAFKTAISLQNVDNTSDANKPVSTAQSTAIGAVSTAVSAVDSKVNPLPWKISGCTAYYDWNDTTKDGTAPFRITQWNDKSGNGKHASRTADTARSQWTPRGAYGQAGPYTISGGITFSATSGTFVWIGSNFTDQDSSGGIAVGSGYIYGATGVRCAPFGCYAAQSNSTTYNAPMIFAPGGGTSIYAQILGSARSQFYANGMLSVKAAMSAAAPTVNYLLALSDPAGGTQFTRITQVMAFYNRELTSAEIASIANYYGAPTAPPSTIVYSFGSSTAGGQASGSYQTGCIPMFTSAIGASECSYFSGGGSWNNMADSLATSGIILHKGARGVHLIFPQTNDLANNISAATCMTAVTNQVNRVRAADPGAHIILCPVTPRNASFTGITYDDFDIQRLALNSSMEALATSTVGIVYCDAMTIDNLGDKGDEANTLYFNADKLHMNAAGHVQYYLSLLRAYYSLNTGAWLSDDYKIVPFRPERDNIIHHNFRSTEKAKAA